MVSKTGFTVNVLKVYTLCVSTHISTYILTYMYTYIGFAHSYGLFVRWMCAYVLAYALYARTYVYLWSVTEAIDDP